MCSTSHEKGQNVKKLLSLLALSTLTLVLTTGCASKSGGEAHVLDTHMTTKQLHHAVMVGGEKAGWTMTKFKANEVIAENFNSSDGDMVTIKIEHGHVSYYGDVNYGDLEDAIYDELHSEDSSH